MIRAEKKIGVPFLHTLHVSKTEFYKGKYVSSGP